MMPSKNTLAKILFVIVAGSSIVLPLVASAQSYTTPNIWGIPPGFWAPNGLVTCTGDYLPQDNNQHPCTSLCDLIDTFINIIYFVISIALFILAPIMCIIGGLMILVAGASPEMLGRGKKMLTGTIVGIILVLCSYLIVNTVITVFNISNIGGFGTNTCSTQS